MKQLLQKRKGAHHPDVSTRMNRFILVGLFGQKIEKKKTNKQKQNKIKTVIQGWFSRRLVLFP